MSRGEGRVDPIVEAFHRISPTDHSLDGLPVTILAVALVLVLATTAVLRWTGRSWQVWYVPAIGFVYVWWAGVNVGHFGFGNASTIVWTVLVVLFLVGPAWRTFRAVLAPARNGR